MGFKQPDGILVLLLPISLLNAESMPDWFLFNKKRIFSGSIIILTWALASTLFTFAFSCNLREILLSQPYEIPPDTAAEIARRQMNLILPNGGIVVIFHAIRPEISLNV
ncbi:uncharacterized protein LOC111697116 [Eurytemora carolleeae]|uniref:uncharacterized protein LOC111697116 n=1 Tax=Eurytemora carolleeae TaxID=1294199 RepID=UPI000C775C4E|nr:uncharacterized protein LOC111697116 [Eurytemora carolleeae]|eukprot:XP_023322772.1 uncharacterized protein LOC111697116 [Eurytemora affinis]